MLRKAGVICLLLSAAAAVFTAIRFDNNPKPIPTVFADGGAPPPPPIPYKLLQAIHEG